MQHSWLAVSLLALLAGGCTTLVQLDEPEGSATKNIGRAPAPVFRWHLNQPVSGTVDYTLVVSRDQSFSAAGTVLQKQVRNQTTYQVSPDETWLPGGNQYWWKVTADILDENGDPEGKAECERPRWFKLADRQTVVVDIGMPESGEGKGAAAAEVQVGAERFTANGTFKLENGETRKITIRAKHGGRELVAGGHVTVVAVNDAARYGRVAWKLKLEDLIDVSQGNMREYSYTLGGDEIVKVRLGGRID